MSSSRATMRGNEPSARRAAAVEELAPDRFIVRDDRALPLLRGEGTLEGRIFELQTWRRDGLLARLRERGFRVLTLADRLAALPALPAPPPIGAAIWRGLAAGERFSHFDGQHLRWAPLTEAERAGERGVWICAGWALRRRRGRGAGDYYLALADRHGGSTLRPLDADTALLISYAQAADATVQAHTGPGGLLLPPIDLPAPYHALLDTLGQTSADGHLFTERATPLVEELLARLSVTLQK